MPRLPLLALVLIVPAVADACPIFRRCRPRPVVVYVPPPCPAAAPTISVQPPAPKPVQPSAKVAEEPVKWATIRGRVVFEGDPIPVRKAIPGAGGAYTEDWVVNPTNRGVKNVIVWLAPEPTPGELAALKAKRIRDFPSFRPDQIHPEFTTPQDCTLYIPIKPTAFVPHVVAMQSGGTLNITNYSGRREVVKYDSDKNGPAGAVVPPPVEGELFRKQLVAERIPISFESPVTPWLKAFVRVFDHPYFAVTNADGAFEIANAPAGNLRLFVWQESAGFRNGAAGRLGDPIKVEKKVLDLGEIKIKELK